MTTTTCTHEAAPFRIRNTTSKHPAARVPIPDETVRCPDCGEAVAFDNGVVLTRREINAKLEADRATDWKEKYEELAYLVRTYFGDPARHHDELREYVGA